MYAERDDAPKACADDLHDQCSGRNKLRTPDGVESDGRSEHGTFRVINPKTRVDVGVRHLDCKCYTQDDCEGRLRFDEVFLSLGTATSLIQVG